MTVFAPERCSASQRARPIPLAPPVTMMVLLETCMYQTERLSLPRPASGRRPRICFSRTRRWAGSPNNFKRLVNFLNLRKNAKIPLAGIGETDEIPVQLALEVGKRRPDRFSGGVSVITRVIAGLADGIYPGRAHAEALISFLRGDGLETIDIAFVPHDALPAKIATIGHHDDRASVVFDLTAWGLHGGFLLPSADH